MYTPLDALTAEHLYRQERLLAARFPPGPRRPGRSRRRTKRPATEQGPATRAADSGRRAPQRATRAATALDGC